MRKPRPRFGYGPAVFLMRDKKRIESNFSQRDDHTNALKEPEFFHHIGAAALKFNSARLILGGRASNRSRNITIDEPQAVSSMNRLRLIRESRSVKRPVEPLAAAISGKNSAGTIAPVGRRGKADNQKPRVGIAKTRQWFRPVAFPLVTSGRFLGDRFAPAHQPRAFVARGNRLPELLKPAHGVFVSTKMSR